MPIASNHPTVDTESVKRYARNLTTSGHPLVSYIRDGNISLFDHGYNNQLFEIEGDYGSYILKVYPVTHGSRLVREYKVLSLLEPIRAMPEVILAETYAKDLGVPVLIYKKLPGEAVQTETLARSDVIQMQDLWQKIQRLPIPADPMIKEFVGPRMPEDCIRYIEKTIQSMTRSVTGHMLRYQEELKQLVGLFQNLKGLDLRKRLWQDASHCLCQVDCRPGNMLKDEIGTIRLVDWEHAGLMDPIYEVAGFFWHPETLALPEQEREYGIRIYCEQSPDKYAFEKMQIYQRILPVQWATRILKMIDEYDEQITRPWVSLRSVEDLSTDVMTYLQWSRMKIGEALLR
jgi:aminoglycoside phosphotransferase (APT) family kinase protein